jgi:hypothetical protein
MSLEQWHNPWHEKPMDGPPLGNESLLSIEMNIKQSCDALVQAITKLRRFRNDGRIL